MFEAAHKSLPPVDYVSMIRSLYADRRMMMLGALSSAFVAIVVGIESGSWITLVVAAAFVAVGLARDMDMRAFAKAAIADDDVAGAIRWEARATGGAAAIAALYGFWVCHSFLVVNTGFAEMASLAVSVSVLVGVAGRNFAIDRLVTIQVLIMCVPMAVGMILDGSLYTALFSLVLIAFFVSLRKVAANIRAILLKAVRARVDASRLATELDTALETMQHGICMLDGNGLVAVVNGRAQQILAEFAGRNPDDLPFANIVSDAAAQGTISEAAAKRLLEIVNSAAGGKAVLTLPDSRYCEVTVSWRQGRTVLLFEDITDRVKAEERISFMAHYDVLTGLPNRAHFAEQVAADLERRRLTKSPGSAMLMIADIDDFKHINDAMGHLIGDKVLVETSERISRALGRDSLVARLGGDEFIVYRVGEIAADQGMRDPAAVLQAFEAPFTAMDEVFSVNVSIGVVVSSERDDDLDALMTKADLALYKAKGNGKAQAQVFHDEMDSDYRYRQRLKADLKLCVAEGGLALVYQPIIDLDTRRVVGCEALARWHHPELGSIPPSVFIPIAEETGLISAISKWVLESATAECRNWPDDISVSVNISACDFRIVDVAEMVTEALKNSELEAYRLEIEITETVLIEEQAAATDTLSRLAKLEIGIALDDFGTGYSSLSYLHALPFTKLKIDRSFVRDIGSNPRSLKLLSNVAQLGKDINLTVTAEGVETEEQLALILKHTGIDQIQGYLFGAPLPRREVAELIARMAHMAPSRVATRKRG